MKKNRIIVGILVLVMGLFVISSVSALGLSPARTTVDFEAGITKVVSFSVLNSEGKDMNLVIAAQGELKDYISVSTPAISMSSGESSKALNYVINMPGDLEPGLHTAEIVVLQLPGTSEEAGAYVRATLAVVTQLHLYVPYPGKYASADLKVVGANEGKEVTFILPVVSAGKFDLVSVSANIEVLDSLNKSVGSFNTAEVSIPSGQKEDLISKWNANVPRGVYRAVVTLMYDGESKMLSKNFNVGDGVLELQNIEVRDFSLGDIAKMEMLVENGGDVPLEGGYVETEILNAEGGVVAQLKSPNYNIAALAKEVLVSYWDTKGVRVGTYDTNVRIRHENDSVISSVQLKVAENYVEVIGLGYVISSGEGGSNTLIVILIIGIGVLILINLLWFFLFRKRLKGRGAA